MLSVSTMRPNRATQAPTFSLLHSNVLRISPPCKREIRESVQQCLPHPRPSPLDLQDLGACSPYQEHIRVTTPFNVSLTCADQKNIHLQRDLTNWSRHISSALTFLSSNMMVLKSIFPANFWSQLRIHTGQKFNGSLSVSM